jgi:hypothetical protein
VTVAFPSSRSIAIHEATHAAALMFAGMTPECVRVDWPEQTSVGLTTIDWGDGITRESARPVLIAILLGAMTDGYEGWDEWPIDPDRVSSLARRDAEQARRLAEYLKFDMVDWEHVRSQAKQLARRQDFRRLTVAIADELEYREVLHREDLDRIHLEVALCST